MDYTATTNNYAFFGTVTVSLTEIITGSAVYFRSFPNRGG
jgi:hypothetical protein